MSTPTEFVTRGISKYLSQSAMFVGAACVAVALPVEAKTERPAPAKVAVKQVKTKASREDETRAAVLKRAAAKDKSVLQVKHVKGLAKPLDDEEEASPRGKKLKLANAKAGRNAKAEVEEAAPAGRKGKAAKLAKAADDETRSSRAANKIAGKLKGTADEELGPKGRKLTKAERIKAERQARLDAEEEARQKRIDSTRDKRLQAQRKAKEEAAEQARLEQIAREKRQQEIARQERQQELARQKRMAAARDARERALEEDRIATLAAERSAGVRVMTPAAVAGTTAVAAAAAVPAVAATPATVQSSLTPAPVSYVPSTPVAAPAMTTPVAVAPAPVRSAAPVRKTSTVNASSPVAAALIGSEVESVPNRPYVYTPNPDSPVAAALIAPQATPARAPVTRSYVAQSSSPVAASLIASAAPVQRVAPVDRSNFVRVSVPANNTLGQIRGMSTAGSPLALNSAVALVMDQNTGEVLLNKNGGQVSPIASITKLMTALVTMDAALPMDERITITYDDVDQLKGSSSRLSVGSSFTRQELLHLALMSSENRAAHALGRTYPGGMPAFVRAMNMRATMLGMRDTNYVEPTGLNSGNRSSARDLALLTRAAYSFPLIRSYTTHPGQSFDVAGQTRRFNNTNRLVHSNNWNIGLQKTGYISEAGRCVVMQSNIDGRNVIIVLLDSNNSSLRVKDAESIRYWVQNNLGRGGSRSYGGVVAQAY